jgi:trehalose-6-phosphate synthase
LSKEEEEGYYYGFANEGLWPLCHIAHTRPIFRAQDWQHYEEVNRKFTDAVLQEIKDTPKPVILVQDYHFALLPRLIKEQRPDARVAIFWHIPWPNTEAFGICPWQRQLVDGLLGADLIGFHIQSHCNNFLQTVDRVVESRVDWEHFSVLRRDHRTMQSVTKRPATSGKSGVRALRTSLSCLVLDRERRTAVSLRAQLAAGAPRARCTCA